PRSTDSCRNVLMRKDSGSIRLLDWIQQVAAVALVPTAHRRGRLQSSMAEPSSPKSTSPMPTTGRNRRRL
ncbi:hypothetical protein V3C99_003154, partial [Haemonchus contortus]